ncbi:trypsin-like peptidase domain-containing protein [Leptolyngbya sp. FACHB-17]|uniref:S1C family serine protease n=1 Tax=unclassified Leptolyngbya TaxID=2650499 RepID=UPI001680AA35|nr:trypsin-like peptidase domain-containing protein [Leptolyngbya sp. FACHB-17]MBD2078754.1 trypsin-like peptidase domain-containing protein [Leptolyngbya sp. FACHB-17]
MIQTPIWSVVLASVFWWLTLQTPILSEPIASQQPNAKIEIARIRSGVLPGVIIGGHHEGWLNIVQQRYTASSDRDDRLEEAARYLVEDELVQAGLDIVRSQPSSVFEEASHDPEPGRFLIGGTLTKARLNSYQSWFKGGVTKDDRTIRWELFDRQRSKVVYRQEIIGSAEAEGIDNPAATYEAIRASIKQLLEEPGFLAALNSTPVETIVQPPSRFEVAALAVSNQPLSIAQLTGRSVPAIVRIRTTSGRGSGFVIDSSGLVITNHHVVGSAFTVNVDLYDGSTRIGRVLRRDSELDAALVQLDGESTEISGLPLCQTNAVRVGESVIAIGNPLSLSNSVTQGIVSGFRRDGDRSLIQTDTAINPGNSGGPLMNRQGAVIGIVTEKIASKGIEGLGFALPIEQVLHRLNVQIVQPVRAALDDCGNPIATSQSEQRSL